MPLTFFDAFTRFGAKPRQHAAQPWTLEHLVAEMRHCSISAALVSHTAQTLYDPMLENRRLLDRLTGHDFLFPIWNAMPHWTGEFPAPSELAREMADRHVRAVMLHPATNAWPLTSRAARPLLEELERLGALTILAMEETNFRDLEQVLHEHPALPILLRAVTWAQQRQVVPLLRSCKNLHVGFDFYQVNYGIERLVELGCEEQLLFCSNATDMSMGAHRFYVDYAGVDTEVKAKIAGGNLARLLRDQQPPRALENREEDFIMAEARQGKPLSPLVLDVHAHILDEGLQGAGGGYTMWNGGPRGTIDMARRMGVDGIGLMSWNGTVGVQAEEGNACVRAALDVAAIEADRPELWWGLGSFDVMHRSAAEMRRQMEELFADPRFLGLKPYPMYGIPYHDRRYESWWEFGNQRHLYAALHPVLWYQPTEFDGICPRWPDLTVVAYHCGGSYDIADTVISLAHKYPNFMMEITLTPVCMGIIDYLVRHTSADRVLYGSDLPMRDPRPQLGWVVYSRLSVEEKLKVLGGNARKLLDTIRARQVQPA